MATMAASPSENVLNEEKEDCSQGADLEQGTYCYTSVKSCFQFIIFDTCPRFVAANE